jgi:hypothetical protein
MGPWTVGSVRTVLLSSKVLRVVSWGAEGAWAVLLWQGTGVRCSRRSRA